MLIGNTDKKQNQITKEMEEFANMMTVCCRKQVLVLWRAGFCGRSDDLSGLQSVPSSLLPWVQLWSVPGPGRVSGESFWQQPQLPPGPSLSPWLLGCSPVTWGLHVCDVTGKWPLGKMAAGSSCHCWESASSLQPALLPAPKPSGGK